MDTHVHTNALTQTLHSYLAVQIRASILWSVFSPAGLLQLAGDSCTNSALPPSLFPSLLLLFPLPTRHSFMTLNLSLLSPTPPVLTASITNGPAILSGSPVLIGS